MVGKRNRRTWGHIRRLPSKRYQASYEGPDLMRYTAPTTYTARTDAEHWLASERRLIERGDWTSPRLRAEENSVKTVTFGEYADKWLEQRAVKERTRIHYRSLLDRQIAPLAKLPLKNIGTERVRDWYSSLDAKHAVINSHAYQLLHAVFATAVSDGLIVANPCQIRRAMVAPRKRDPVILTVDEVAQLADVIRPQRFKAFILISSWCGTRYGETMELRRKDFNDDCSVITVTRGVTHRGACRIDTPKSGKGRAVVVPPHIRGDLLNHLKTHVDDSPEALLFPPARGGCHIVDKVARQHFNEALDAIGRDGKKKPRPTLHSLRHFAGTQAARVGNLVETMGRLGHRTPSASLIYQSIASGRDAEVADALSKLARPDTPND